MESRTGVSVATVIAVYTATQSLGATAISAALTYLLLRPFRKGRQ